MAPRAARPYARHTRPRGADQAARIAASIAEFGWTVPVLVGDDGEVIAGYGRLMAASELGLTEAPVIVLGHLTRASASAAAGPSGGGRNGTMISRSA